ncbi:MAG: decaprenylphospho-beta-D-ribofuranose 2-oxidase, partial [Actinomycetota bacterium]|nr:decaprenylphospho-beta-D-ribofuranose 2-oxidase [Actinomycetota bacterium]
GYGLTGNILTVELAVESTPGPLTADVLPVVSLSELPAALEAAEREWTFVHSWHDLRPRQSRPFGPGYLQVSRFADGSTPEDQRTETAMTLEAGRRAFLPMSLLRGPTVRAMNAVHGFRLGRDAREGARTVSLFDSQFPIAGLELYFYLFGRRGFGEHQVVVPHASFADWAERLHSHLRQWPIPITLGSAKTFGAPQKLLSFSGDGVCFAINIPRIRGARRLLEFLDNLTVEVGGRPNLIKDSRLPREVVDATYLEADAFRAGRREFDPLRRYRSELSERLAL